MERKSRRVLTGLVATGVIAGAVAGGTALAATGSTASAQPAVVAVAASSSSAASTAAAPKGAVRFARRHHFGRLVFRTAAAYLGLTHAQLHAQLHAGKSLATVAGAQGKSVNGLESAIMAAVTKRVDASHQSATRKAVIISDVQNNLSAFVNATHPFAWADRHLGQAAAAAGSATSSAA